MTRYRVKKGDVLIKILKKFQVKPLYGKNGFINLVAHLNKIKQNGNFLKIGQIIELPIKKDEIINVEIEKKVAQSSQPLESENKAEIYLEISKESRTLIDEFPNTQFIFTPKLTFLRVDVFNKTKFNGSSVSALSKTGFSLDISGKINYNEQLSIMGIGSLDYYTFYQDPNFVYNPQTLTRMHFGLGGLYKYSVDMTIKSKFLLREVSFLDIQTLKLVNLETMPLPEIYTGLEKTIFSQKKIEAKLEGHVSGFLPSSRQSYKSKLGYGVGTGLEIKQKKFGLVLSYDYRAIKVGDIKSKENEIVLGVNFY